MTDQPDTTSSNESNDQPEGLNRRDVLQGVVAVDAGFPTGAIRETHTAEDSPASDSAPRDLIERENAKPGTRDWLLTKTRTDSKKVTPHLTSGRSPRLRD